MVSVRTQCLYACLILVLCVIGFRGLPSQPWTYDDLDHIVSAGAAQDDLSLLFSREAKEPTRWVLNVYFLLAYKLFGENPSFYHAINIPLHAFNALLCAYLILILFSRPLLAGVSGILFALNCAGYEAVYEISATGILIGTAAALISVTCVLRYLQAHQVKLLIFAALCYIGAVLSYESFASVLIPILYLWWIQPQRDYRLPLVFGGTVCLFVIIDSVFYSTAEGKVAFNAIGLGWHVFYNFGFFVGRLFVNAFLTPIGWDGPAPFDVPGIQFDGYALGGGILFFLLLFFARRHQAVRFSVVWLTAVLLPYILGTQQFYFSRYWYLATVGSSVLFALFFVGFISRLISEQRKVYAVIAAVVFVICVLSFHKMQRFEGRFLLHGANFHLDHRDDASYAIALYERARDEYDIHTPMLYNNLSAAFIKMDQYDRAFEHLSKLVTVRPDYANAYRQIATVLIHRGDYGGALRAFLQAAQLDSTYLADLHRFADDRFLQKQYNEALEAYRNILKIDPSYANIHLCLFGVGRILAVLEQEQEAIPFLQQALEVNPSFQIAKDLLEKLQ